ncbi:MAG: AAA family ATPase [Nocardioides sp.]
MDERTWSMLSAYRDFLDEAVAYARSQADAGAPRVGERLQEFLGVPPAHLPVVRLDVPPHQFVNLDVAMDELVETHGGGLTLGIGGGDQRHHQTFGDMVQGRGHWSVTVGAVDRDRENTGPHSSREVVTMGIRLFRYDGVPVAALQRRTNPQYGSATGLEVIAPESVTGPLLTDVRRLMVERSVYRGQVLSFAASDPTYGQSTGGISFLERPQLTGRDVVLPPGALTRIERHVAGAAQHRAALRAAAQHLKRGVLLYGPPGTGKTHTIRYLLGRLPGATVVILAGNALGLVAQAAELAQALQPAVVVLEDVDLIAEHRDLYHAPSRSCSPSWTRWTASPVRRTWHSC